MPPESWTVGRAMPGRPVAAGFAVVLLALLAWTPNATTAPPAADVVVYLGDLPKNALYELELWKDKTAASGKLLGVTNIGEAMDPPPENDPRADFKVTVQAGVPYRCWLHMKVGKAKGKSTANLVYAQFSDAVSASGAEILKPRTKSYLSLLGPAKPGWVWVGSKSPETITFRTGGQISVRLQAGMEGVGFDQLVLSPARFLETAPSEAIVEK
jgi:hypothetical protein